VCADATDAAVYHYRDSDGLEVDVIVEARDGTWGAFEVKLGTRADRPGGRHAPEVRGQGRHRQTGPPAVLGVITVNGYGLTRPDGVVTIPIGTLGP